MVDNIGSIDYNTGKIVLNSFRPQSLNGEINLSVKIADYNVYPIRNQILLISNSRVKVLNDNTGREESLIDPINTIGTTTTLSSTSITFVTSF